LQVEELIPR